MQIRVANENDAASLATIAERTFRDTFGIVNHAEEMDAYVAASFDACLQRVELRDPDCTVLFVERDGDPIGYAQLRSSAVAPMGIPAHALEIQRFYVDRRYHGAGTAQLLMRATIKVALDKGASVVWLGVWDRNVRAIAFYLKYGFVDVGSHPFQLGADVQTDRIMRKDGLDSLNPN